MIQVIFSKDMSSAYPAVMLQKKFPMSRFVNSRIRSESELKAAINKGEYAYLISCEIKNINIKTECTIPYIAFAKLIPTQSKNVRKDNGRVLSADAIGMVITDIDYRIISQQYDYKEEDFHIDVIYRAKYDYLPNEFRKYIFDRYIRKCDLKPDETGIWEHGDKYLYSKEKNKINANFGMTLTDIIHDEILYEPENPDKRGNPFKKVKQEKDVALRRHYKSRSTFLVYQWGIWVTAWCRYRLQQAIVGVGYDAIYCDTDSVKYFGFIKPDGTPLDVHADVFERLNNEILEETAACGFDTEYTRPDGKHFSLGLWEDDDHTPYKQFVTMGSKKYGYVDSESEFHITVAGLSKEKGAKYLTEHEGGIEGFHKGTRVPPGKSGRTAAHYQDLKAPEIIRIFDPQQKRWVNIVTGSSVAIKNVPYKFGITGEYEELLEALDKPIL